MRTKLFTAFFCGFILVGQIRSQEVVVAREAKRNASEQGAPRSENSTSGHSTSAETRPQGQRKKSGSTQLTIEQMRMAGALAAERPKSQAHVEPARVSSNSQTVSTPVPSTFGVAKPIGKETRDGQTSASHTSNLRNPKSEVIGPVRPTMIESGKETPDPSPATKAEVRGGEPTAPQSGNRSVHRQGAILAVE
jgi:hypothetical protein